MPASQRLLNMLVLLLVAAASAAVYQYNYSRVAPPQAGYECQGITLPVPGGEYTLNYTLARGPAGVSAISYWVNLGGTSNCTIVQGTATAWRRGGPGRIVPWQSPLEINPILHPRAGGGPERIVVNTYPLPPYAGYALVTYNRMNFTLTGVGELETDYGVLPVYAYEAARLGPVGATYAYEYYKLYYEAGTGMLAGVDYYSQDLFTGLVTLNYTLMLSQASVPKAGGQALEDPDSSLLLVATAGLIGGAALALAAVEALKAED